MNFALMWKDPVKRIDAEFITLGQFSLTYKVKEVDIVKIDCEGSEQIIIENSQDFFKNVKMVLIEHHPEFDKNNNLQSLMTKLGFKIYRESGIDKTWVKLS